jgi:outer membrane protein OmpA-like peptidoglycan-associated protein
MQGTLETAKDRGPKSTGSKSAGPSPCASASLHPILALQQQAGNQAVQSLLRSGLIQAKLAIGQPDDPDEREADQVADRIMRSHSGAPISSSCSCSDGEEMCEECGQKQQPVVARSASNLLQRQSASPQPAPKRNPQPPTQTNPPSQVVAGAVFSDAAPPIVHEVLRSSGRPLDVATRNFMEPRFGRNFGGVRVHTDAMASDSAGAVNALAYTAGRNIVFAERQYAPNTLTGRRLLAHELSHVVQQEGGHAKPRAVLENEPGESVQTVDDYPPSVLRRTCGPSAIGTRTGCEPSTDDPLGDLVRFKVNCDDFLTAAEEKKAKDFADSMETGERVRVHGFASVDGPAAFNLALSCARAQHARETLVTDGVDRSNIDVLQHGPTPGAAEGRRSVVLEPVPGRSRAPSPQLNGSVVSGPTVADCGGENFLIRWTLSRPAATAGGFVIQDVTFNWHVTDCAGNPVATPPFTSPLRYFEAWLVSPGSAHPNEGAGTVDTDLFSWPKDPPWGGGCSDGTVSISGSATYHDNVTALPGSMVRNNPATFAGSLRSSTTAPALGGAVSRPFAHTLQLHWRCCPCSSSPTVVDSHTPSAGASRRESAPSESALKADAETISRVALGGGGHTMVASGAPLSSGPQPAPTKDPSSSGGVSPVTTSVPAAPNVIDGFVTGSAVISPANLAKLQVIAAGIQTSLKDHPDSKALVVGHTDAQGNEADNMALGMRRAVATRDALAKMGVPAPALQTESKGQSEPVDNSAKKDNPRNRRAEVRLESPGPTPNPKPEPGPAPERCFDTIDWPVFFEAQDDVCEAQNLALKTLCGDGPECARFSDPASAEDCVVSEGFSLLAQKCGIPLQPPGKAEIRQRFRDWKSHQKTGAGKSGTEKPKQQTGNQVAQSALRNSQIQAKLAISNPGDPDEREADQVADRIMRSHGGAPISSHCSCSSGEEMCEECKQKQQGAVARKAESAGDVNEVSSTVPEVVRAPGQPLDSATRSFFEPRFGHDFSNVRLHTGSQAAESAHSIQALAYTAGHHIVFANGMYNPETSEGRLLLGHELTHTIQQGAAQAVGTTNSRPGVQVQNKDFVQRQTGHTQTGPSAAEQKAIALKWTDHDIDFYHNTVAAVATSFGLSQAALWQPAHDPTFSFYRKYTTDHPRANAGDKILVTVSLNHWPGRVPEVTDFAILDAAAPSPIPIAPPAQPLPQPAPPCPPCPESPRTQGCPECPPEPPVFLCNKPVPGHAVHRQGHLFLRVGGSGPGNPTFELEHDSKGDHCKCGFQGIPQRDYPEDRDATDADCIPAPTVTASCLAAKFSSYPVGMYCALGPNSNTYAHFLLNACGGTGLTPPGNVPGFNDSPPIAGTSNNTIDVRLLICDCTGCNECDSGVCKATGSTSQPDNSQPSVQTPIQRRADPNPSHAGQRMLPDRHLLALQQQAGNQAVQSLLRASLIQAKLAISQPDDPAEHEADQVADRIMRMRGGAPISSSCSCSGGEQMCEECQKKQPAAVSRSASGVLQRQSTNPQPTPQTNPPLNQQNNLPTNQATNPQASASSKPPQVWNSSLISAGVQQTALPYCYGESGGNSGLGTNQKTTPGPFSSACSHPCAYLPLPLRVQFHTDGVQGPRPGVNPGDKVARVSATVKFEPAGGGAEIVLLQNQGDATYVSPGHPLQTTFNTVLSNFTLPGPGQLIVSLINSDSAGQGLGIYSDTIHVDACPGVSKPGIPVPSTSVQLGKWLVVPDPDNAPLQYSVVDKNTPINGPGVMVQVEKDDKGYFYRYNGRRVDLPGNPPYPGAQVQPGQNQPAPTPPAPVESAPVQRSAKGDRSRQAEQHADATSALAMVQHEPGRPLDAATRAFFEPRFGRDFSDVRVHSGGQAAESARSIQALAYTAGNHIVFGASQHQPSSEEGKRLLAHELAHVAQQADGIQRQGDDSAGLPPAPTETRSWQAIQYERQFPWWHKDYQENLSAVPQASLDLEKNLKNNPSPGDADRDRVIQQIRGLIRINAIGLMRDNRAYVELKRDELVGKPESADQGGAREPYGLYGGAGAGADAPIQVQDAVVSDPKDIKNAEAVRAAAKTAVFLAQRRQKLEDSARAFEIEAGSQGRVGGDSFNDALKFMFKESEEDQSPEINRYLHRLHESLKGKKTIERGMATWTIFSGCKHLEEWRSKQANGATAALDQIYRQFPFFAQLAPEDTPKEGEASSAEVMDRVKRAYASLLSKIDGAIIEIGAEGIDPYDLPAAVEVTRGRLSPAQQQILDQAMKDRQARQFWLDMGLTLAQVLVVFIPVVGPALAVGMGAAQMMVGARDALIRKQISEAAINPEGSALGVTGPTRFEWAMLGVQAALTAADLGALLSEINASRVHFHEEEPKLIERGSKTEPAEHEGESVGERGVAEKGVSAGKPELESGTPETGLHKSAPKAEGKDIIPPKAVGEGHELHFTDEGAKICSPPPCSLLRKRYRKELGENPELERQLEHAEHNMHHDPDGAAADIEEVYNELKRIHKEEILSGFNDKRRVAQYFRDVSKLGDPEELAEARQELAMNIEARLPEGTQVSVVSTERTEAGAAQGRVADRGEAVVPDVEYEISLPDQLRSKAELPRSAAKSKKAGTFKPDDIRFYGSVGKGKYVFVDHKEVQTIWKDSYYASDRGSKEIRALLERDLRIAQAMPGCDGWLFTTNDPKLEEFLQNEIQSLGAGKLLKTEIVP